MAAEFDVTSNFSFLRGASHPEELVSTAKVLGLEAIGLSDRNSLAGVVRAHVAAKEEGLRFLPGARLIPGEGEGRPGPEILCYPTDRAAYGRLCRLLTLGKRRAPKGQCWFTLEEIADHGDGQIFIVVAEPAGGHAPALALLRRRWPGQVWQGVAQRYRGRDLHHLRRLIAESPAPSVALGGVVMHHPARKPLLDLITCIREKTTIDEAGWRLAVNAEGHLKPPAETARLFAGFPALIDAQKEIADRCRFSLDELRYEYPEELGREGRSPQQELEHLTWRGAAERYPLGVSETVRLRLRYELDLIDQLGYAPYFLTVEDIVRFARERGILCQGRGSAANSAVCYCLGITAVDPARADLLFERFVSAERGEPPDIDVDFEHERREEVIQHIYEKYGRERAGLAATVITYRARGAIREAGKAMGLSEDTVAALAQSVWGWSADALPEERVRELGLDPGERRLAQTLALAGELIGFPRHLSQHVGGFVMTDGPLSELAPIENAAMEGRTVVEWDKDDLDALGILKVDVLALGMLSCLSRGFELLRRHYGRVFDLASVPAEDEAVYDMICQADTLGVFQIESRAQMTMLPRLKPRDFYDLVIEVAIVRPGPIQGDMVHPYLRRRNGEEEVTFPSQELEEVLGRTLGVPLFQEQAMKIAIVAAGFSPGEADRLRRAMATFRKVGTIHTFRDKMVEGMAARGYERDFAERCFKQIEGFGTYGFPESHAASFALLVYVSAWLKRHYPDVFAAALLNAQPMGFYAPAQIVRDAREHGVEVRPPDVNFSDWDCTLEVGEGPHQALRLGLRQIKGLGEAEGRAIAEARGNGYADPRALWRRAKVGVKALEALARGDAFSSLGLRRREALWAVKGLPAAAPLPLFAAVGEEDAGEEEPVSLPELSASEQVVEDYASLRLSLKGHPVAFLREELTREAWRPAEAIRAARDGARFKTAGLVLVRQRPGTAKGVIFLTLEDETGIVNVVVWADRFEANRGAVLKASLLGIEGKVQKEGAVIHLVAGKIRDLSHKLASLQSATRDILTPDLTVATARADEVKRPNPDPRETAEDRAAKDARKARARDLATRNPLYPSRDFR